MRPLSRQESSKHGQKGVVLLEAMISILIFSFAVLGLVGLQAAMVKNTSEAKFRADATLIAQDRLAMMWTNPSNLNGYTENNTDISSMLPSGARTTAVNGSQVTVTVTWQQPGESAHNVTTLVNISGN